MLNKYLKTKGDKIIFTGEKLEVILSAKYLERGLSVVEGRTISTFGLLDVIINGKTKTILNLPSLIMLYPDVTEDRNIDGEKCTVCIFGKNSTFMDLHLRKNYKNVELFINILFSKLLLPSVKYKDILSVWLKNLEINEIAFNSSCAILEIIIAEVCRNPKNPEKKFALSAGKDAPIDETSYTLASIRNICAYNSTYAALTFEDMDNMITQSLNINKYDKYETKSPLEEVIKM